MMLAAYRIFKTKYSAMWLEGEGAYRFGGRWNTPGTRLMYASESLSLALLEVLVHLEEEEMASKYSSATIGFDEMFVVNAADFSGLPENWGDSPIAPAVQAIGDAWARSLKSLVLRVPSAIVRGEFNYLINVEHKDLKNVKLGTPETFIFDNRLVTGNRR